jgi:Na+-driven multidrug efflux pump
MIIKEITNITFPAIICQFCLVLPNTINIWAAGQMDNAMIMDVVGLGMGITEAIGMAIFLGLNGALY